MASMSHLMQVIHHGTARRQRRKGAKHKLKKPVAGEHKNDTCSRIHMMWGLWATKDTTYHIPSSIYCTVCIAHSMLRVTCHLLHTRYCILHTAYVCHDLHLFGFPWSWSRQSNFVHRKDGCDLEWQPACHTKETFRLQVPLQVYSGSSNYSCASLKVYLCSINDCPTLGLMFNERVYSKSSSLPSTNCWHLGNGEMSGKKASVSQRYVHNLGIASCQVTLHHCAASHHICQTCVRCLFKMHECNVDMDIALRIMVIEEFSDFWRLFTYGRWGYFDSSFMSHNAMQTTHFRLRKTLPWTRTHQEGHVWSQTSECLQNTSLRPIKMPMGRLVTHCFTTFMGTLHTPPPIS